MIYKRDSKIIEKTVQSMPVIALSHATKKQKSRYKAHEEKKCYSKQTCFFSMIELSQNQEFFPLYSDMY